VKKTVVIIAIYNYHCTILPNDKSDVLFAKW